MTGSHAVTPDAVTSHTLTSHTLTSHTLAAGYRHVATFCGSCSCGCPELFVDESAPSERRIVITDDFGQRIQLSVEQLRDLVADVKTGVLDELLVPAAS